MLRLAQFSRPLRAVIRALWIAGGVGYALFAVVVLFGDGRISADVIGNYYACFFLVPATLCLLRAALVPGERVAWTLFGVGLLCWSASEFYYFAVVEKLDDPPFPSLSDALWLSYYAGAVVALLLLMRSRLQNCRRGFWIDAVVGGLAIAAVGAALLVEPILASTGGSVAAVMTNMAYPLFDVLVISVVLAVFVMTGWRPGSGWLLFGAVAVVLVVCDTIYLYQSAAGTYEGGTPLALSWPACMMLIAVAAWQRPVVTTATQNHGWPAIALTAAFALVGLGLSVFDHWRPISDAALVLATLTLAVAFARTTMTIAEMRSLAHRRALATELILNAAGDGICGLGADGRITFANPEAAALTGYERRELVGRHFHDTIHHSRPDGGHYPFEQCPVSASLQDGIEHRDDQDVYWRRDGSSFPVEFTSTPAVDGAGAAGAVLVFKDVTARKAAEDLLERQRQQLIEAQSVGGFGSWEWDLPTGAIESSAELLRIYGISQATGLRRL